MSALEFGLFLTNYNLYNTKNKMKMPPTKNINVFTVVIICIVFIARNSIADGNYNLNIRNSYWLMTFNKK